MSVCISNAWLIFKINNGASRHNNLCDFQLRVANSLIRFNNVRAGKKRGRPLQSDLDELNNKENFPVIPKNKISTRVGK